MRHVNKVELLGRLFADPEIKGMPKGGRLCTFKLVTDENKKNKDTGEWDRKSEFHRVTVWNEDAIKEIEGGVRKGCTVQVVGKIQTRKYQAKDERGQTQDRYSTEIVVDRFGEFQFLEAAKEWNEERRSDPLGVVNTKRAPAPLDDDPGEIPF